ncbi:MAG: cohesin domain-containing protein [Anaerolineales bacterium]
MHKKIVPLVLALLLPAFAIMVLARQPAVATTAYLGCKPANLIVKTGQSFYLTVAVTDTLDLYAWQLNADYNPTYLEFQRILPGKHLYADGASYYYIQPVDPGNTEAQRAAATRLSCHQGIDGSGDIAYIFFRAKTQNLGGTIVDLRETLLVDRNALEITKTLFNSSDCRVYISNTADDLIQPPVGEVIFMPLSTH